MASSYPFKAKTLREAVSGLRRQPGWVEHESRGHLASRDVFLTSCANDVIALDIEDDTDDGQYQQLELIALIGLVGKSQFSPDHVRTKISLGNIIVHRYMMILRERPAHQISRLQVHALAFGAPIDSQSRTAFQGMLETVPQSIHPSELDELCDLVFLSPARSSNNRVENQ